MFLGVSSSNLNDLLAGTGKPRRSYHKVDDAVVFATHPEAGAKCSTCGYRCNTALLNREMAAEELERTNHKRVYRITARRACC